jgi:uncharacterized protein with von Willebrand factor type A (vWA) domain
MRGHAAQKRKKRMNTTEATDKAATAAEQGAHVAPEKAASKKGARRKNAAPMGPTAANGAKAKSAAPKKEAKAPQKAAKPAPTKKATTPRAESKSAKIIEMIGRAKGATLAELMKATGWQAHSVRGFLSTAGKKHGLTIESVKNDDGGRTYTIKG